MVLRQAFGTPSLVVHASLGGKLVRSSNRILVSGGVAKRLPLGARVTSYADSQRETMDAFHAGLHRHPELITTLPDDTATAVLAYLLGLACEAQNDANISYGRRAITAMPLNWLAPRIHSVAERELNLTDDWECRRLLELYSEIDSSLLTRFAQVCCDSPDSEIAEAGRDFIPAQ